MVTAAGGAICGATAEILASMGADLVINDLDAERLARVAATCREWGVGVVEVPGDLTERAMVEAVASAAIDGSGRADVLVNGLGHHVGTTGPFDESTEEQWQALYEVNLLHVIRLTRALVPNMKSGGWGRIVNMSSVEGTRAAPELAVYAGFKRAVDGFTRSLAVDLARFGILVNAVGVDKTKAYQVNFYELPEEYEPLVHTWVPVGRYGAGIDVARLIAFLASPLNSWVVGDTIYADGGTLAAGGWFRTPERWTNTPLMTQYLEDPDINSTRPPHLR